MDEPKQSHPNPNAPPPVEYPEEEYGILNYTFDWDIPLVCKLSGTGPCQPDECDLYRVGGCKGKPMISMRASLDRMLMGYRAVTTIKESRRYVPGKTGRKKVRKWASK